MLGVRRKCRERLVQRNARLVATGAGRGGDSKGPKGKDGSIDFNALFKSVSKPAEKKEGAPEPIDFKKLFGRSPSEKTQFKLDLTPPPKKEGAVDNEKLKIDLGKLFADSSGPRTTPGDGGLRGFKLDFSKLKTRGDQGALPPKDGTAVSDRRDLPLQKMGILNKFAGVMGPSLKPIPPKDHLLEKYLSVENMSAPDIHKLELQKVRSEFKLHDSDCGSSAVQIAALSKRISFLSKHLIANKKDIPSRRGMNTMIQRRRKLLIYLRRKDWDMYCHVLARLNLKDRLDISHAASRFGTNKPKDRHKKKRTKSTKARRWIRKYLKVPNDRK